MAGHVEDPLLRIERRELAADLRERVDDARGRLAHAGPEGGAQAHGAGADDGDVADVGVGLDRCHVREMVRASPSSALTVRSSDALMQVKLGVSRRVKADASVVRRRWTRSRNAPASSVSKATTNSWSSSPNE